MDGKIYLTTTDNLSPLQAQIDLALAPNAGLADAVFQVDVKMLRSMGVGHFTTELVPRLFNITGGGVQRYNPRRQCSGDCYPEDPMTAIEMLEWLEEMWSNSPAPDSGEQSYRHLQFHVERIVKDRRALL